MDTSYITYLTVLAILDLLGSHSITGLTLCGNTRHAYRQSQNSFSRSGICRDHERCVKDGKKCAFAKLSCRTGHSIYNPMVQGLHSSKTGTCTGLTSQLMIDTSSCHWKNMCTIKFPKVPIIVKHLDGEENCSGKCIHAVHVRNWQCIKNTMIHKMCDETASFEINTANERTRQGVVRSHEAWPFLEKTVGIPGGVTECNKTFYPHLLGVPGGFTKLALVVVSLDLHSEFETLRAESNNNIIEFRNNDWPSVHVFPDAKTVVLSLRKIGEVNTGKRIGGSGFVICFKFVRRGENPGPEEVCGQVFEPNRRDAKCINCKYKRKGKRIRDSCKDDTEGVRIFNVTLLNTKKQVKDGCRPWSMVEKPCKKSQKTRKSGKGRSNDKKKRIRHRKKGRGRGKQRGGLRT
ncbi:uncharacterized protein LOC132551106 [Ylistrum balloti]|uniref:uncharacterized protein LOC132551106 n=1 Tax=Ylistrum balloti TaxID=509963 RepID=UPI002905E33F|nr:uncharacterized protein LOC132551106 [Ylistrum balloti]